MEPVLGNLDPYSGTWTRTRLCTHPYSFLYSWPNIGDSSILHCKSWNEAVFLGEIKVETI